MKKFDFREELARIAPRLRDNAQTKIYAFGAGQYFNDVCKLYKDTVNINLPDSLYAIADNDAKKQGKTFMGLPVVSSSELDCENDIVIITTLVGAYPLLSQLHELNFALYSNCFHPGYFDIILRRFLYAEIGKFNRSVEGGRCFIIGNGPSLRIEDLEVLHKNNEITFASNKIYNCFSKTDWRPTYYFLQDAFSLPDADTLKQLRMPKFFASYIARSDLFNNNVYYFDMDLKHYFYKKPTEIKFSSEIEKMFDGTNVSYFAIQGAVAMGYNEIYLLGIDAKYGIEALDDGTLVRTQGADAHFYAENQKMAYPALSERILLSFESAKKYANEHGIKIYNATRGGALEVFERVDFDSLF